jgi:catechol 2,3-dioxygenase-like lactoylglutathione lyase family enzyme
MTMSSRQALCAYTTSCVSAREPDPEAYVVTLRGVFAEARRVLADHGTCWLNLGDSYSAGEGAATGPHAYAGKHLTAHKVPGMSAVPDMIGIMIGRTHHVVLDCPDPAALAAFYSTLLGLPVTYRDDDWLVVAASDTSSGPAFQRAPGNQPPTWPDPAIPQQIHLDIMVEDVAAAGPRVLALGAVKLNGPDAGRRCRTHTRSR